MGRRGDTSGLRGAQGNGEALTASHRSVAQPLIGGIIARAGEVSE